MHILKNTYREVSCTQEANNTYIFIVLIPEFETASSQLGFWPLNAKYKGTSLVKGNGDFELHAVDFSSESTKWLHAAARFTKENGSYAEILSNEAIKVGAGSFSWIGAVKLTAFTG